MSWVSRLVGTPLPSPEYVSLQDPLPIIRWMRGLLDDGRTPHLKTFVSAAVRLCQSAGRSGIMLDGAQFTLIGEPITDARLEEIRKVGGTGVPEYGSVEVGSFAEACHAPETPDDVHLMHDLVGLIQATGESGTSRAIPAGGLMVTALRRTTPLVIFNLSMGDRATLVNRSCGCPMEKYGWTSHLHTVRSYEKLNSEGMTFADADVIHVLDEVLPRRFGGGPTDYQLVEGELDDGRSSLVLRVHPRIGPLDKDEVRDCFLQAMGESSGVERVMERVWREANLVTVERQLPAAQENGKILHFRVDRLRR
jgi:hypothetical protein